MTSKPAAARAAESGGGVQLEELVVVDREQLELAVMTSPAFLPLAGSLWMFHFRDGLAISVTIGAGTVTFGYSTEGQRIEVGTRLIEATGGTALAWPSMHAA